MDKNLVINFIETARLAEKLKNESLSAIYENFESLPVELKNRLIAYIERENTLSKLLADIESCVEEVTNGK